MLMFASLPVQRKSDAVPAEQTPTLSAIAGRFTSRQTRVVRDQIRAISGGSTRWLILSGRWRHVLQDHGLTGMRQVAQTMLDNRIECEADTLPSVSIRVLGRALVDGLSDHIPSDPMPFYEARTWIAGLSAIEALGDEDHPTWQHFEILCDCLDIRPALILELFRTSFALLPDRPIPKLIDQMDLVELFG